MASDPYYGTCARSGSDCRGRITWEHAFTYAGKQINEKWSIIPLCVYHHLGLGLDKRVNEQIAVARATKGDLKKYPRKDWAKYLNNSMPQIYFCAHCGAEVKEEHFIAPAALCIGCYNESR
jgi:hypothetical protein